MPCLRNYLKKLNRINPAKSKRNYKLFKSFLAILIVLGLVFKVSQNLAQEASLADDVNSAAQNVSMEAWTFRSMETTTVQICNSLMGECPDEQTLQQAQETGQLYLPGGLIGMANNLSAQTFNQPISGVQYLAQLRDNLLGKPAYAQGYGFEGLQPLLPIWKGFRDIIYLISSVFFIVLGIMIMFRLKINPQTILTVQNAIPKVITTLLLVTFSYAIAGLLIDLSYLIQNIGLATLFVTQGKTFTENLIPAETPLGAIAKVYNFKNLSNAGLGDIFNLVSNAFPQIFTTLIGAIIGAIFGAVFSVGGLTAWVTVPLFSTLGGIIGLIIIAIVIAISLIKFFLSILKVYVNIILKIILAPLEIGIGMIPGVKIGFSSWLKDLFANLLVFPIVFLFLVIINIIIEQIRVKHGVVWAPSMVRGDLNLPGAITSGITSIGGGMVSVALGFATIALLPKLPELIPQIVFAIKPSPWQSAIGETYDLSKKPWFNFAKQTAGTQILGPAIYRSGETLKSDTGVIGWLNKNIHTRGKGKTGIAESFAGSAENIGSQLAGEKGNAPPKGK